MRRKQAFKPPDEAAKHIQVPTYDELLELAGRRLSSRGGGARSPVSREISRLQSLRDTLISRTDFIRDLVSLLDSLHPFYWSLIEVEYDRDELRRAVSCVSKARKLTDRFFEKYRILIMASESPRELRKVSRDARGRILSLYKRCARGLVRLRSLVVFLRRLPSINPELPTIIVSGPPSSGKSTFVRSVSRAKPKVAEYPFTTREIHVGHVEVEGATVQVIDTPGLLDRDIAEMNEVERRAVAALSKLEGPILFLVDPSDNAYMDLERQLRLLKRTVARLVPGKRIYIAVNKADLVKSERLEAVSKILSSLEKQEPNISFLGALSALDRGRCMEIVMRIAREWTPDK